MTLSLVLSAAGWLAGWWLWGRPQELASAGSSNGGVGHDRAGARTTVVVPARNEAAGLEGLLEDLLSQTVDLDVVVVDDHSSDGTAEVAAGIAARSAGRILVEPVPPLPQGWVGKNWACHHGAQVAVRSAGTDEHLLVFIDADVRLAPNALEQVQRLAGPGRAVSVQPFHTTERWYEQLSLFPGVVALGAIGAGRRGHPPSGVCGPLLAMTVGDHRRIGGHAAVRSELVEDLALGARLVRFGVDTRVLLGGRSVRYRMYPEGSSQLLEGWTKNLAAGAGAVPWWRAALTASWVTALGDAALDLARVPRGGSALVALSLYVAFVLQVGALGRRIGTFRVVTALLYPVPLAAFVALFLRSVWYRWVRHGVRWRGRWVPTGRVGTGT